MTNKKALKKPLIVFFVSLLSTILCVISLFSESVSAQQNGNTTTPEVTATEAYTTQPPTTTAPVVTTVPYDVPAKDTENKGIFSLLDVNDNNGTLDLVLLITILSLAPSILVMMTSFTRIIIVFSLLRNAMGVQQTPPNQVLVGLALFLTLFIMKPVFSEINTVAYQPYKAGEITTIEACKEASVPLKKYMLKQTSNDSMSFFLELAGQEMPTGTEDEISQKLSFEVVVPAYIISEIKTGFTIGFLLFIPFLIIDIVVSSVLMSMGMIMLPPAMISLPFKILLFILVDGWTLLSGALVRGFNL